jgi:hypothetical protein
MIPFMIQHKCVVLAAVRRQATRRTHTKGIAFYSTEAQATTGKPTYADGLRRWLFIGAVGFLLGLSA